MLLGARVVSGNHPPIPLFPIRMEFVMFVSLPVRPVKWWWLPAGSILRFVVAMGTIIGGVGAAGAVIYR